MDDSADCLWDEGFPVLDDGKRVLDHEVKFDVWNRRDDTLGRLLCKM